MCVSVQESVEIVVFLNQIIDYLHAAHTQTHTHTQNSDCGKLGSVCRRGKKGSTQKSSQRSYAMLCEFVCLCVCVCVCVLVGFFLRVSYRWQRKGTRAVDGGGGPGPDGTDGHEARGV